MCRIYDLGFRARVFFALGFGLGLLVCRIWDLGFRARVIFVWALI